MEFTIRRGEPIGQECQRILRTEIDGALQRLREIESEPDLSIHLLRKHNKRIRGMLRLQKAAISKRQLIQVNALVRDSAKLFSDIRDAFVAIDIEKQLSIGEFGSVPEGIGEIRAHLAERHELQARHPDLHGKVEHSIAAFSQVRIAADTWDWSRASIDTLLAGWEGNYTKGRLSYYTALATHDPEDCHDWRKQAKYLFFHCQLLSDLESGFLAEMGRKADTLASWLGEHHDLAVFRKLMTGFATPAAFWLDARARDRQVELETFSFDRGADLFCEPGADLRDRLSGLIGVAV